MLKRSRRIDKHHIALPRQQMRVYHADHITMAVSPQEVEKPTKCAVIVSKKGITAPMRNKLRRRAYEAIGTLLPFVSNGYLCVCSIRKGFCGEIPYGTFIEEIRMLFKKADILNDL